MEISLEHVQCDCGVQASVWWKAAAWGVWTEGYFWLFQCLHCKVCTCWAAALFLFENLWDDKWRQSSNRNFFDRRLVASASRSAHSPVTSTCDTDKLCAVQNGWGSPAGVTRVSVKCINVSRTISCCSGDKEGGKNFDSHTHSHATVAESLYGLQGALMTLGALPGASHSWSWLLKKRLPLLVLQHKTINMHIRCEYTYIYHYIIIYIYTWAGPGVSGRKWHFFANPK